MFSSSDGWRSSAVPATAGTPRCHYGSEDDSEEDLPYMVTTDGAVKNGFGRDYLFRSGAEEQQSDSDCDGRGRSHPSQAEPTCYAAPHTMGVPHFFSPCTAPKEPQSSVSSRSNAGSRRDSPDAARGNRSVSNGRGTQKRRCSASRDGGNGSFVIERDVDDSDDDSEMKSVSIFSANSGDKSSLSIRTHGRHTLTQRRMLVIMGTAVAATLCISGGTPWTGGVGVGVGGASQEHRRASGAGEMGALLRRIGFIGESKQGWIDNNFTEKELEVIPMPMPPLTNFQDNWEPLDPAIDVPVLWHIPEGGEAIFGEAAAKCHRKVVATEGLETHLMELEISTIDDEQHVNVNTYSVDGLFNAGKLGLVDSSLADIIVSPYFHQIESLLFHPDSSHKKGRVAVLIRNPLERAVRMFKHLREVEPDLTLEQFAESHLGDGDRMTRQLSMADPAAPLHMGHLAVAMDILRRKVFVGLTSRLEESISRFESVFGWNYQMNPAKQEACRGRSIFSKRRSNAIPPLGSREYDLLLSRNKFDVELYKYIEVLFEEQSAFLTGRPEMFRFHESKCAECGGEIATEPIIIKPVDELDEVVDRGQSPTLSEKQESWELLEGAERR